MRTNPALGAAEANNAFQTRAFGQTDRARVAIADSRAQRNITTMPARRGWRATRGALLARHLAPVLVVFGAVLTVVWAGVLAWVAYRILW
jgi:hypothetical protein